MIDIRFNKTFRCSLLRLKFEEFIALILGIWFALYFYFAVKSKIGAMVLLIFVSYQLYTSLRTKKYFLQTFRLEGNNLTIRCYRWRKVYIDGVFDTKDVQVIPGQNLKKFLPEKKALVVVKNKKIEIFQDLLWNNSRFKELALYNERMSENSNAN